MASSVATLSLQGLPSVATPIGETKLEELDCGACPRYECRPAGSFQEQKYQLLISGTDTAYELANKYDLLFGFGTDTQGSPALAERQGAQLAKLTRYYEPWEVLKIATSQNYEIFKRSGPRDPYPGDNGVVREGPMPTCCWSTAIHSRTST